MGVNKITIYSLGIHHLEIVMGDALCVLIGSTESVCSPYDAFKKKKKGIFYFKKWFGDFKLQI